MCHFDPHTPAALKLRGEVGEKSLRIAWADRRSYQRTVRMTSGHMICRINQKIFLQYLKSFCFALT
jgi:hypothetical protein